MSERTWSHSGPQRGEAEPAADRERPGTVSLNLDRDDALHAVQQGADDRQHAEPRGLLCGQSLRRHHAGQDQSPGKKMRKPERTHPRTTKPRRMIVARRATVPTKSTAWSGL